MALPLKLLHPLLESLILGNQGSNGPPVRVQLPVKHVQVLALPVGGQDEAA